MKGQIPVSVPILGQKQPQVHPMQQIFQMLAEGLGLIIMRLDRVIMLMEVDLPEDQKTVRLVEKSGDEDSGQNAESEGGHDAPSV